MYVTLSLISTKMFVVDEKVFIKKKNEGHVALAPVTICQIQSQY